MSTFRTGYPVTRFVVGRGARQLIITDRPTVVPDSRDAEVIATAQESGTKLFIGDAPVPVGPGTRPGGEPTASAPVVLLTLAQYTAITSPDPNTLYVIVPAS